jgi:hypothetical protein
MHKTSQAQEISSHSFVGASRQLDSFEAKPSIAQAGQDLGEQT